MEIDERTRYAIENTVVLRPPRRLLETFGPTAVSYFLLTEPVYSGSGFARDTQETVVREGRLKWGQPRILTQAYMTNMPGLEGFGPEATRYFQMLAKENPDNPGILYTLKREEGSKGLQIVSEPFQQVADNISRGIDRSGNQLSTIILGGLDELWDVSLIKFATEMTGMSLYKHIPELGSRGLLAVDASGIPIAARYEIDGLFQKVQGRELPPQELKDELDRWNLFPEYQDRFFGLFRRR